MPSSTSHISGPAQQRLTTVVEHLNTSKDAWHGTVSKDGPFKPERGRYHMYIGLFCPFAHRANLFRHLKGLTDVIPISVVRPYPKGDDKGWPGWKFGAKDEKDEDFYLDATEDRLFGTKFLHEVYFKDEPKYPGRYSVPVLWDTKLNKMVNNESSEIMRNLQTGFNELIEDEYMKQLDFYPADLRAQIDEISGWVRPNLNNGVYRAGFAESQEDYDKGAIPVFAALNKMERLIASNGGPFVLGHRLTEIDLLLYPTIVRFDTIYVQHLKVNLGTIRHDYPQINNWMKGLYWGLAEMKHNGSSRKVWGFGSETVDFRHIKENYSKSHSGINPRAITPRGPFPAVEEGYEKDFSKIRIGQITMNEAVDQEKQL